MTDLVIGVDGCKAGWVVIALADSCEVGVYPSFDAVMARWARARVIAVDMPVGLLPKTSRTADDEVRRHLAPYKLASSLFPVPPRPVVNAKTYAAACERCERLTGKKVSRQTFALFGKIREVDRHATDHRLIEVHPETCFTLLGETRLASKRTWSGAQTRRRLLAAQDIVIPDRFDGDHRVGVDDVLDAGAAAWSARRWLRGIAREFPTACSEYDRGRPIRIVA